MNIRATAKHFSFLASCVTGYDVQVVITEDPSYVGYTSMPSKNKATIVLSAATSLYNGLNTVVKLILMLGVLAHEAMHLCFTNFDAFNRKTIVLSRKAEKEAFHEIGNVVEDAAIEYMAHQKIGGKMLKALAAVIKHTWTTAPSIEEDIPPHQADAYAYTQVIRALIQVGDRGSVKGNFISELARNAFADVLPLFNAAVIEPDGEARVDYYVEIYKILLPLIRKQSEEAEQSLPNGKPMSMPQGMGEGETGEGASDSDSSDNTDSNSTKSPAEIKQKMREDLAKKLANPASSAQDDQEEGTQKETASESAEIDSEDSNNAEQAQTLEQREAPIERPYAPSQADEDDLSHCDDDMEFTEDDIDSLLGEIENTESQIRIAEAAEAIMAEKAREDVLFDSADVINVKADNPNAERYQGIVNAYSGKIATLKNEMQKIFMNDRTKVKNSNRGPRVNTKRLVDGKLRSNILLQRTYPKDLDDMAVYLLIDKSGSMGRGNRQGKSNAQCATETAICLYEALQALRIPVYITGFTTRGRKALHMHYVTWHSPSSEKYTLANFAPDDCNYDYYSITEATRVLKKHPAKHKLLIVISDGAPCNAAGGYDHMSAVNATACAIENARKNTDILGVAMNCYDETVYASMYGKDYISVSTANDMFLPIADALKQIVKSW